MQALVDFVMGHQLVVAAFVMGLLDLVVALIPSVESNGVFHLVYLFIKGLVKKEDAKPQ